MRICLLLPLLAVCLVGNNLHAQSNTWAGWQFLIGEWDGQGTGKPGEGVGGFSLQPDLDGKILIRKNHADYPATKDRPAFSHQDIMIISPGETENTAKAVYYDNEGHVINYSVSIHNNPKSIIFISEAQSNAPRFRLTYMETNPGKIDIKFEIAPPGQPESFSPYIDAMATRRK